MEGISDICIVGIDEKRPPRILKEPYINLFFKLSHKIPADWANDFNLSLSNHPTKPKVSEKEGLFINAWVRKPDEIAPLLELLKKKIVECNLKYIERAEKAARGISGANSSNSNEVSSEQARLNQIIANLIFDVPEAV